MQVSYPTHCQARLALATQTVKECEKSALNYRETIKGKNRGALRVTFDANKDASLVG
jgi:hypothetical protein